MWKLHNLGQIYPRQKASCGDCTKNADLSEELKPYGDCTKDADLSEVKNGWQLTYRGNEVGRAQSLQEDPFKLEKPAIAASSSSCLTH